ncbi:MAG TPA: hypothetical protein VG308_00645 [Stellaceae bacterium]|jgi:hypothetical protein|nr:hypothetical protein [Stellaceae bacterium]
MSLESNSWLRRVGLAAIAAVALGAMTIPTAPAQAALRVFGGPGGIHIGIVQHRHHDWWRQPGGYYTNYNSPYYQGWHDYGWYR